jgi:DNA-binding beta-propeller fold protein YncE
MRYAKHRASVVSATLLTSLLLLGSAAAQAQSDAALRLDASIPLAGVRGRIDHLFLDASGRRLFIAALGNNSIELIDAARSLRAGSITGLKQPQGVLYLPSADRIYATSAKDGSVRMFSGTALRPEGSLSLGEDADNIRIEPGTAHLYVGYGDGALAELTPDGHRVGLIRLSEHPESFQLEHTGPRVYVNQQNSGAIAVLNRHTQSVETTWRLPGAHGNFAMALDEAHHRLFTASRQPTRFLVLDTVSGKKIADLPTVGDCDDLFYDAKRQRVYLIGGEGAIAVIRQEDPDRYNEIARISTRPGARTGFFSDELDRLYVAVRGDESHAAEIRVYLPRG